MFIDADRKRPEQPGMKELKVRVPKHLRVQLHGWKIMTGQGVSETVVRALDDYLRDERLCSVHRSGTGDREER